MWNVLSRSPVFADLAEHPVALRLLTSVLDWPMLLGNLSANITGPGGGEMVLHADQIFVPTPWPADPQGANAAWCVDDFTADNGATCFVPGSHLLHRLPEPDDDVVAVPMEAPAGSLVVFESRLWHRTGFNRTSDQRRAGIFGWYTRPIYRAQENWFLSLDPSVCATPPTTCSPCSATRPRASAWSTAPHPSERLARARRLPSCMAATRATGISWPSAIRSADSRWAAGRASAHGSRSPRRRGPS